MVAALALRRTVAEVDAGRVGAGPELPAPGAQTRLPGPGLGAVRARPQVEYLAVGQGALGGGEGDAVCRPGVLDAGSAPAGADQPAVLEQGGVLGALVSEVVEQHPGRRGRHRVGRGGLRRRLLLVARLGAVRLLAPGEDAPLVCGDLLRLLVARQLGVEGAVVGLLQLLVVGAEELEVDALAVGAGLQAARTGREPDLQVVVGGVGGLVHGDDPPGDVRAAEGGVDAVEGVRRGARGAVGGEVVPERHIAQRHRLLRVVEDLQRRLGHRRRRRSVGPVPDLQLRRIGVRRFPYGIERRAAGGDHRHQEQESDLGPNPASGWAAAGGRHGDSFEGIR